MDPELFRAICAGDVLIVDAMIERGVDVNAVDEPTEWTPLLVAVEHQQHDIVRLLLAAGADVNYAMPDGWTALHHAVDIECDAAHQSGSVRSLRTIELLVASGADRRAVRRRGGREETAADFAEDY